MWFPTTPLGMLIVGSLVPIVFRTRVRNEEYKQCLLNGAIFREHAGIRETLVD